MTAPPRVVAYVRMSSDKQEDSPARQRPLIEEYAKSRGYQITRWYTDLGMSGWRDDRPDFQRMLADARAGGFDVILLDEPSRLSRSKPFAFIAEVAYPLQESGVSVETAATGPVGWDDLGGQIIALVNADKASDEVVKLSRRVLTGMINKARAGLWQGAAPLGYRVERVTDPNNPARVTDRFLVPGDPLHVAAVRWVFSEYAAGRRGKAGIATELAARGVFSPRRDRHGRPKPFTAEAIRLILVNRAYLGEHRWNAKSEGKFHKFAAGQAVKKGGKRVQENAESDWVVIPNRHEPLIDVDTFQAARARLAGNNAPSTPHADGGGFKLSKLLTCAKCGAWFYGYTDKVQAGPVRRYRCGTYNQSGKKGCDNNWVDEGRMVRLIGDKVQGYLLNPATLDELRAEVRRQEEERFDPTTRDRLEKRLAALEKTIKRDEARLLELPADVTGGAVEKIRADKAERDGVKAELAAIAAQARPTEELERAVEVITARVFRLREVLERGEPADVRAVLSSLIDRVELQFTGTKTAKTVRTRLVGGVIHLKRPEGLEVISRRPSDLPTPVCRTG